MQNLALQEAFEPVVRQNEKNKKWNSNVRGAKKIDLLIDRFFSFSHKTQIIVNKSDLLRKK